MQGKRNVSGLTSFALTNPLRNVILVGIVLITAFALLFSLQKGPLSTSSSPIQNIEPVVEIIRAVNTGSAQCDAAIDELIATEALNRKVETCYTLSEHFPQHGGEGCPCTCDVVRNNSVQTVFGFFDIPQKMLTEIRTLSRILQAYGHFDPELKGTFVDINTGATYNKLHLTLLHHCCLSTSEVNLIGDSIRNTSWSKIHITFQNLTCARVSEEETYILLNLHEDSTQELSSVAEFLETSLVDKGVDQALIRKEKKHFYMKLGSVDADFPCNSALSTLRRKISEEFFSHYSIAMKYLTVWDNHFKILNA